MMLSDAAILEAVEAGDIVIRPFNKEKLGTNSYDVHLSKHLSVYKDEVLDPRKVNEVDRFEIPEEGYVLQPNRFYLGSTLEYTENHRYVPLLDGKSSVGRLGISIHSNAGIGDIGFCNHWTLHLSVFQPVRIYPGMPIGQLIFLDIKGEVLNPYNKKSSAKYNATVTDMPQESMMWKNEF